MIYDARNQAISYSNNHSQSEYMAMSGFSDETAEMNDYYKYSTYIAGPDMCKRGNHDNH